jgi:hypothetical protein
LNGISRALVDVESDMTKNREFNFKITVNQAFEESNGDFTDAALRVYNEANSICPGEWIILVAGHGRLAKDHFCGAYRKFDGTSFNATYRRSGGDDKPSHAIQIFAPKCEVSYNKTL